MAEQKKPNATKPKEGADQAYKAATHASEQAPHEHPAHAEVTKESTGRKADDSWKSGKK